MTRKPRRSIADRVGGFVQGLVAAAPGDRRSRPVNKAAESTHVARPAAPAGGGGHGRDQHLPLLRGRLRAARLRQGRPAHRHRGRPAQPDQRGHALPQGGGDLRPADQPAPRRPRSSTARRYSDHWEERPLDWAMDRIAQLVKRTRDETFVRELPDGDGRSTTRSAIGTLGGATLDNEENYLIKKLFSGGLGMVCDREPGPDMTQRLGARSGRLVRPRRGHHCPAGPGQQRLHPDHGLEHGRGPPGRLPLRHEGEGDGARR